MITRRRCLLALLAAGMAAAEDTQPRVQVTGSVTKPPTLSADDLNGYQVVFSLAELDPAFTESQVLLADTANQLRR